MGQSTVGTSLTTTAVANSRKIACRFYVDWADTGFGDDTTVLANWTNETAQVKSVRGEIEAVDWLSGPGAVGKGVSNVCYVTMRNHNETPDDLGYTGFKYSPTNADGSLYAYIGDGKIFMKRAIVWMGIYSGAAWEYLRQITGYIVGHQENYKAREVTFEIRDRAANAAFSRESTILYTAQKVSDWFTYLVTLLDDTPTAILDDGMLPLEYAWMDDETLWNEMQIVSECQLGRTWFDKDGDLHFDDGAHFVKPQTNAWDDPTISQAAFTTASFAACNPKYNPEAIFNATVIEYQPRYIATNQIVHTASEIIPIRPLEWKHYRAEFRTPVYYTPSIWAFLPGGGRDISLLLACTAGGTDISTDINVFSWDTSATYGHALLLNENTKYTAYITQFKVSGQPVLGQEPVKYECEDVTSIGLYGKRTLTVKTNPYITTWRHAQLIGDYMLARYKDPIGVITLTGVPARPWLEPGDRVTVTEADVGFGGVTLTDDFFVGRIGWSFSGKAGYLMDIEMMRCQDVFAELATDATPYFIVGTSVYGAGAGSGKLFW